MSRKRMRKMSVFGLLILMGALSGQVSVSAVEAERVRIGKPNQELNIPGI